jgi:cytochrome c-type biogenesis protein CcmH/NrfG
VKRFFVVMILCLLAVMPKARADGPDDQYVTIYNLIQQGDLFYDKGQTASARAKYEDALSVLKKFQTAYPDWNVKVVKFRITYLTGKLADLAPAAPKLAQPAVVVPTPTQPAPAPAPASTPAPSPAIATTPVTITPKTNAAPSSPPLIISSKPEVVIMVPPPLPPAQTPKPTPTPPPVALTPTQPTTPPVTNTAPPPTNIEPQIRALQEQVTRLEGDKVVLEAKLKEALSARPAAVDPRELAAAQDLVKELQKENELLKASLADARTNSAKAIPGSAEQVRLALAEANRRVTQLTEANATLTREKESLQGRVKALANPDAVTQALREENQILKRQVAELRAQTATNAPGEDLNRKLIEAQSQLAVLQSDKELLRLEKMALETRYKEVASRTNYVPSIDAVTAAKIKQMENQRDDLQKKLDSALQVIEGHKAGAENSTQVEQMTQQLADLHARIDALEAKPIPYTPEELAMFDKPATPPREAANPNGAKHSVRELPASAAVLVAQAKHYYATQEFDKSEAKYLEVLKLNEKNVSTLADLAMVELRQNRLVDAEKHITNALTLEPDNDYSLVVFGQLRFQQTNYDAALDAFSKASRLNPQEPEIQNWLGIVLSEKGQRGPAEAAFRRAVQIDPKYANAHINLAFVYVLQKPALVELARLHYQKALAVTHARNMKLEALLDAPKTATP